MRAPPRSRTPAARPPSSSTCSTCAFSSTRPPCFFTPLASTDPAKWVAACNSWFLLTGRQNKANYATRWSTNVTAYQATVRGSVVVHQWPE